MVQVVIQVGGQIDHRLLILACAMTWDTLTEAKNSIKNINLRVFADENGKMNLPIIDITSAFLVVRS